MRARISTLEWMRMSLPTDSIRWAVKEMNILHRDLLGSFIRLFRAVIRSVRPFIRTRFWFWVRSASSDSTPYLRVCQFLSSLILGRNLATSFSILALGRVSKGLTTF